MKELSRKKSVKISILLIIILVVMGIVGINVRSAKRQRKASVMPNLDGMITANYCFFGCK